MKIRLGGENPKRTKLYGYDMKTRIGGKYWTFNRKKFHVYANFTLEKPRQDHKFILPIDEQLIRHRFQLAQSICLHAQYGKPFLHFEKGQLLGYYKSAEVQADKVVVSFGTYNPIPAPRTIDDEWF